MHQCTHHIDMVAADGPRQLYRVSVCPKSCPVQLLIGLYRWIWLTCNVPCHAAHQGRGVAAPAQRYADNRNWQQRHDRKTRSPGNCKCNSRISMIRHNNGMLKPNFQAHKTLASHVWLCDWRGSRVDNSDDQQVFCLLSSTYIRTYRDSASLHHLHPAQQYSQAIRD